MGKVRTPIIAIFIVLIVILAVVIYVIPGVTGMLVETYTAEYGDLSIYDDTRCYFIRNETVYGANSGGGLNRIVSEGDLIRPFTAVVEVSGDAPADSPYKLTDIKDKLGATIVKVKDYKIETGGIVSFYVDGYENELTLDKAEMLGKSTLSGVHQADVVDVGNTVREGYPVFKIVDNNGWGIIAFINKAHLDDYPEGSSVDVTFFDGVEAGKDEFPDLSKVDPLGNRVEMIVERATVEGDYGKLILKSTRYFSGVGQYREAACRIVSQDVRGLLIENDSIIEKDGLQGVYVKDKVGNYYFVPVLIFGSNDTTTVIADTYYYNQDGEYIRTVSPFEDIVRKPEGVTDVD